MFRTRHTALALLLIALAAGCGQALTFAVVGDNRPHGANDPQPAAFKQIIGQINAQRPAFAVELGDKVLGSRSAATMRRQFADFKTAVKALEPPLHYTVGNHDVGPVDYEDTFGPRYHSFDAEECHFVVLDSYQPGETLRIGGAQWVWLQNDLAAHKGATHTFVFLHAPLWPKYMHIGSSMDAHPKDRDRLAALLKKYGVKEIFVGHNHFYDLDRSRAIAQFNSGGGGAELYRSTPQARIHHFLLVKVEGPVVTVELHPLGKPAKVVYRRGQ